VSKYRITLTLKEIKLLKEGCYHFFKTDKMGIEELTKEYAWRNGFCEAIDKIERSVKRSNKRRRNKVVAQEKGQLKMGLE